MNRIILTLISAISFAACTAPVPPRVLIYSHTNGYRHQSIEAGRDTLVKLCYENGILADTTENPVYINERNLKRYAAVVFLNTNGDVLNPAQEADFERYIQSGGGYMGVHSASATEYTWRWFGRLTGAYFKDHPAIQETTLHPEDEVHPAVCFLHGHDWKWKDEWYNFRNYESDLHILLTIDEHSYQGGSSPEGVNPEKHPIAWCHEFDGGRAFYTALGHIPESYGDPQFQQHLLGGLRYAIGKNKPLDYSRCHTPRLPDQTRFVKTVVASNLSEPMEIAELPNGKVLMVERHGQLRMYDPGTGLLNTVAKLPVYSEMGDGLMGLGVDPHWSDNHWIYLYYSSLRDSMNQLSRFVFQGDTLDRASEKVLLTVGVGRKDCVHAAGSITFDGDENLYLSTGDNTSPFASDGFDPLDEQPGRQSFDAQRSAGNTHDLRGKILRIRPLPDGSYICPAGNLFNKTDLHIPFSEAATYQARPEIYVMGCRNPFRISYDERRKYLFWGEVGPDAGKNDTARGPMGYDEINRARASGNFGWPYFVANNLAYRDYDFSTKKSGPYFDPLHPVNQSPNNTGLRDLPPAQPAFIWYPYGKNREFPIAGTGGRNAMAGPVFYSDKYPENASFPDYYNGKVIIYDWMRNWLMAVTMDTAGNFYHLEPFADSVKLTRPMDMFFSQSGSLWLIEYGTRWYSSNEDARLSHLDFVRGNRAPLARISCEQTAVAAGTELHVDCSQSDDYDGDDLKYTLDFGDGTSLHFNQKNRKSLREPLLDNRKLLRDTVVNFKAAHTYQSPGTYYAVLHVTDPSGASDADSIVFHIGNEAPRVQWNLSDRNHSFYRPGEILHYKVQVNDREDGSLGNGIAADAVSTSIDFLSGGVNPDKFGKDSNQPLITEKFGEGKRLVEQSDCFHCHAVDHPVNGPAFEEVAARYRPNRDNVFPAVYRKIIYGGSGHWGNSVMIPHPQIREEDAIQMALWILSLGDPPKTVQTLPLSGDYLLNAEKDGKPAPLGAYVLRAGYRDQGANGQPALHGEATLLLRPDTWQVEKCDSRSVGVGDYKPFGNDTTVLNELKHNAWFVLRQADLSGVKRLVLRCGYGDKNYPYAGGKMEIHQGSIHGPLIGEMTFESKNAAQMVFEERSLEITPKRYGKPYPDLYFLFKNEQNQGRGVIAIDWIRFEW